MLVNAETSFPHERIKQKFLDLAGDVPHDFVELITQKMDEYAEWAKARKPTSEIHC